MGDHSPHTDHMKGKRTGKHPSTRSGDEKKMMKINYTQTSSANKAVVPVNVYWSGCWDSCTMLQFHSPQQHGVSGTVFLLWCNCVRTSDVWEKQRAEWMYLGPKILWTTLICFGENRNCKHAIWTVNTFVISYFDKGKKNNSKNN